MLTACTVYEDTTGFTKLNRPFWVVRFEYPNLNDQPFWRFTDRQHAADRMEELGIAAYEMLSDRLYVQTAEEAIAVYLAFSQESP